MQRAHTIRLNPTPEQEQYFRKAAGTARFVYNWGLAEVKRALSEQRKPESVLELKARFNAIKRETFPWVVEVTKCASEGAFRNLGAALKRVACLRADAQHKATTQIARKAALIGIEDLNVAGMLKNRKLAQALSDASLSEFHRQLRYKAAWHGGRLVAIDRFYPSSKIHNGCSGYNAALDLSDRMWICEACGKQVDRDLNAARNIRDEALRVSVSPVVATSGCELPVDAV
jgi:IS605 OrfB family transposase